MNAQLCRAMILLASSVCVQFSAAVAEESSPPRNAKTESSAISFDTGVLQGSFRFGHGKFPGIGTCVFVPASAPLTNDMPPNALLMPEWILTPKGPRDGILWTLARKHNATPIPNGARFEYPDKLNSRRGLRCRWEYEIRGDVIHLAGRIEATRRHANLEVMFASYLPNRFDATYSPQATGGGMIWQRVPRGDPWKSSYMIASSPETRRWRRDGRISDVTNLDWNQVYFPEWTFAEPILVAMEEASGLAAVHFVDANCTALIGQPHDQDTAHDFTWGWPSLEPGQRIEARAALWITRLAGTHEQRMQRVVDKYEDLRPLWKK